MHYHKSYTCVNSDYADRNWKDALCTGLDIDTRDSRFDCHGKAHTCNLERAVYATAAADRRKKEDCKNRGEYGSLNLQ